MFMSYSKSTVSAPLWVEIDKIDEIVIRFKKNIKYIRNNQRK